MTPLRDPLHYHASSAAAAAAAHMGHREWQMHSLPLILQYSCRVVRWSEATYLGEREISYPLCREGYHLFSVVSLPLE